MLKNYQKIILVGKSNPNHRLDSTEQVVSVPSNGHWLSNVFAISTMIMGALFMTLFFSVFFALLLIPASILGVRVWRLLRKLKNRPIDQSIDAEYTVITETAEKYNSGK